MKTELEIKNRIEELKADERLTYPTANVFSNAPLAVIQLSLTTELHTLQRVLGVKLSKMPLRKPNGKKT